MTPSSDARIAIVHEWWGKYGGSERVTSAMAEIFPHADVWCLYKDHNVNEPVLDDRLRESWLSNIPFHENRLIAAALAPVAFRTLGHQRYDLVLSSSHTFGHLAKFGRKDSTSYISYVHTPARALWVPDIDDRLNLPLIRSFRSMGRTVDKQLGQHVHSFAANSSEVSRRIKDFWNRDSTVIHPPVQIEYDESEIETSEVLLPFASQEYLVSAGRLVKYKRHDFAIKVASESNIPIVIMGVGPEEKYLRFLAEQLGATVHFEVNVNRSRWLRVLQGALALVFAGVEDFGITPVESMALGTPVVAFGAGGVLDYLIQGRNGLTIDSLNVAEFSDAVAEVSKINRSAIKSTVRHFGYDRFALELSSWVDQNGGPS